MSGLLDGLLGNLMQGDATEKMAGKLGIESSQAKSALAGAVPILMQALNRNASTPEGASALENALKKDHSEGNVLDNLTGYLDNPKTSEGSKILDHILGDKRSNVEKHIGATSGLASDKVSGLLSMVAPLIMNSLAGKQSASKSGIGDVLSSVVGEVNKGTSGKEQGLIANLLDRDNDGDVMDDIADMGGSLLGKMLKK